MTSIPLIPQPTSVGLCPIVDPDLPAPVRGRLRTLDPTARPAQHAPGNQPDPDGRRTRRAAIICGLVLGGNFAAVLAVTLSSRSSEWMHTRMDELLAVLLGQLGLYLLVIGGCWFIGAARALRRRAPLVRRRYAGRYLSTAKLRRLHNDAGQHANIVFEALRHRDRITNSRAYRDGWLTGSIDDYTLDAVLWHITRTVQTTAAAMDAVSDANTHPNLLAQAHAGATGIAAALRAARADLHHLASLADTAAHIDTALNDADNRQRHHQTAACVDEELTRQRQALAAVQAARPCLHDCHTAATATARYLDEQLTR